MRPENEAELADMIKAAKGPLRICGGDTRQIGRAQGTALETSGLSGITLYEPGALTLVARAGTPLAEVKAALAAKSQRLSFEPADYRRLLGRTGEPTIGGVVASNSSGPRRITAGACRDSLIGVRFVDGAGRILKNGGRVMKNVTGYDLVKLMAGSYGTLGVITEVSFKVLPAPKASATVVLSGLDDVAGVAAMSAALGMPYDVNGAARVGNLTALRVEGLEDSVKYRAAALADKLGGQIGAFDWAALRDVRAFAGHKGDVWRFSVKPSDAPGLAARLNADAVQYDWGGGLIWAIVAEGTDLRARMGDVSGHATLVRASAKTKARIATFHPEPAPLSRIAAGLRAEFDPRGILNQGLMTGPDT
ncbi:MAG: FAD-binding protein [Paracoccaceae bacterium]